MNKLKIALLICAAAAPLPALAQVAPVTPPPPPPLGFFELAEADEVLAGVAAVNFTGNGSTVFAPAVAENPATTAIEAKPAALGVSGVGIGLDPATLTLVAANASSNGSTTITAAVPEDPDTVAIEAKAAVASTAVTETNAALNSGGVTFSKYTGTATCDLNADEDACVVGTADYDATAFVGSTAVTADGVTITNGTKTVSVTSNGLNNGGNVLAGVADGVADTDAVNRRQLNSVRNDLTAVRNDLTTETNSRIVADNVLRDQIASSTATAIALGGAVILPDVNFSLSGNVGFYEGATALALNAAARVAPNTYVTGAIGGGLNKNGAVGGRVGFALGF